VNAIRVSHERDWIAVIGLGPEREHLAGPLPPFPGPAAGYPAMAGRLCAAAAGRDVRWAAGGGPRLLGFMVAGRVLAPGGACVYVLPGGGGVVESEGVGNDGGGDGEDELAQGGDAGGAQGQAEGAELGGHGW
jgi:hypothetical protein